MIRSMYSGVSGLKNHQIKMDVIANNIANVNTCAFKASRVTFQDVYSQTIRSSSAANGNIGGINPMQIGLGMTVASIDTLFGTAAPQITGQQLDLYLEGDGFFVVYDGENEYYTRAGNFAIDNEGNIVLRSNGLYLLDENGGIIDTTGFTEVSVNSNGEVTGIDETDGSEMVIAVLGIAVFSNPSGLLKVGGNMYAQTQNSGDANIENCGEGGAGYIRAGSLELSNVDLANEFTEMITTQRGFQANSRIITTSDSMLEELVNLKR